MRDNLQFDDFDKICIVGYHSNSYETIVFNRLQ